MAGVGYCNLKKSKISYKIKEFELFFSSQFYKNKFINGVQEYIDYNKEAMNYKYKLNIDSIDLSILAFYIKVEKRGFRVYYKDSELDYNNLELRIIYK